jgi:radical SAM superfamily enzyme YgiQ (UPF0313 family)
LVFGFPRDIGSIRWIFEMQDRPRVLLIAPTALDFYGNPIKERRMHLPALTLPLLAGATPADVNIKIIYETVEDIPYDQHWDLVGLTSMGSGIVRAWQIADKFKGTGTKIILGGISASIGGDDYSLAHVDTIVKGEAEDIWPIVIEDYKAGRLRKTYCPDSPPAIERLPVPRFDLMNKKTLGFWRPVQATRGCPYTCSFCSVTAFFQGSYRKRPVDQVIRDIRQAKKYGSRYIAFVDDNIGVDFEYCRQLWEALIPERIIWMCQCSLQISEHPDLMKLAHRSGCRMLSFGIESVIDESLEQIDKKWNKPSRYRKAIRILRKHGIDVSTEMVLGLDGDDKSIFEKTYKFIMENGITVPRIHIITPIPGTPFYKELKASGRILTDDFGSYTGSKAVFRPLNMAPDTLLAGYWKTYERLFSWMAILKRIVPNRARLGPYMLAVVWAVNYRYRKHIRSRISPGIL